MEHIIIYTKDNCMPCRMTKEQLKRHEVDFIEINLDEHPEKMDECRATGFTSMPVVCSPIGTFCQFRPDKLKELAM